MPLSAALVRRLLVRSSHCLYKAEGGESEERRARAAVGGACASSLHVEGCRALLGSG